MDRSAERWNTIGVGLQAEAKLLQLVVIYT